MWKTIAIVVAIGAVTLLLYNCMSHKKQQTEKSSSDKSLYDRLGGVFPISAVVNHFSDALLDNPVVGKKSKNKYLNDWSNNQAPSRLPGLKFMRTLWLCSVAGGPFEYSPVRPGKCPFSLENAHKELQISPEEFDAVALELSNSLDVFNVPEKEKGEVLSAFAAHKNEVTMGYNDAHGTKTSIKC